MSDATVDYRTISEWTAGFKELYEKPDSTRKPEEFWNASMAHTSGIGEAIRRYDYPALLESAAHAFCWMSCYISFCNETKDPLFHIKNHFSELVGLKFPDRCGHCGESTCCCRAVEIDDEKDKSSKYTELYNHWKVIRFEDYTLKRWLDSFWRIFNQNIHLLTLENIGFHLLEEAGEHALAVRQLVQFRGILNAKIKGIDEQLLIKISEINGLVEEYANIASELKSHFNTTNKKEAWKMINHNDPNPIVLKARLLKSKMDFVIEFGDTFSWFCAVLLKLNKIIEKELLPSNVGINFEIEEVLKLSYKSKTSADPLTCYACNSKNCECLFYPEKL